MVYCSILIKRPGKFPVIGSIYLMAHIVHTSLNGDPVGHINIRGLLEETTDRLFSRGLRDRAVQPPVLPYVLSLSLHCSALSVDL